MTQLHVNAIRLCANDDDHLYVKIITFNIGIIIMTSREMMSQVKSSYKRQEIGHVCDEEKT